MARPRRDDGEASFDSLLDTMTNVVGILVIMLVVTLLGVRDAVQRIKWKLPDITPQELAELKALASEKQEKLDSQKVKLDELQKILAALRELQEQKKALEKPLTESNLQQELAVSQKALDELKKELAELKKAATEADQRIADLKRTLASMPKENPHGTKVIRMPNPRSPVQGATPVWFVCRYNRIAPLPVDELTTQALERIVSSKNRLVEMERGKPQKVDYEDNRVNPALNEVKGWVFDPEATVKYFDSRDIGDKAFQLTLAAPPPAYREVLYVTMRKGVGDHVRDLESILSPYRKILRDFDTRKHYARYIVYPDSFEVYVRARELAEAADIPAGWVLYYQDAYPIASNFGLHFKGEPRPKPPPKTPPGTPPPKPIAPVPVLD